MNTQGKSSSKQQYVWLLANSFTRWLWVPLATYIERATGLIPLLVVSSKEDERYYRQLPGGKNLIMVETQDPYLDIVDHPEGRRGWAAVAAEAEALERRLGFRIMRDFVLADRHLGRSYLFAGQGHPDSHTSRKARFGGLAEALLKQFSHTEALFDEYPPEAILSYYGGGGIRQKPIAVLARARGVAFRAICPARLKGLAYWADDEYEGSKALRSVLAKGLPILPEAEIQERLAHLAPSSLAASPEALRKMHQSFALKTVIKQSLLTVAKRLNAIRRGFRFAKTGYLVSENVAYIFRKRSHWKLLNRIASRELPPQDGRKVVYVPLQQEPEASTLSLSPNHTNQIATVAELSLALPADTILLVKEHIWQLGRRPVWFYEAIRRMPNAILLHPAVPGLEVVKRADLVATITSSAGFEAAAMGKQVVFFWERCPIIDLPHVQQMSRFEGLERIADLLHADNDTERSKRRADGAAYMAMMDRFCLDLDQIRFYTRKEPPTDAELDFLVGPLFADGTFNRFSSAA
ncbi:hypothetical protein [Ferrovibrio sp.]|uniref:hypothetical protein n=1 Tax=Ferrovibrio sp. TaxID=1917215 RepID=UPI0025B801A9|nr:hypothetical protein [Ferrovibrio sp.]MBX3456249.1 hypothetical protein [Ferrovibrio sp.]